MFFIKHSAYLPQDGASSRRCGSRYVINDTDFSISKPNDILVDVLSKQVSKSIYIRRLKARLTKRHSLILDEQIRLQLSSELSETVRWLQWSRQLVPKPQHQTTCRPHEFWTMAWRIRWHQTSGDGDWPQAPTCMRLLDESAERAIICHRPIS